MAAIVRRNLYIIRWFSKDIEDCAYTAEEMQEMLSLGPHASRKKLRSSPKKQPSRDAINTAGIGRNASSQPEATVDSLTPRFSTNVKESDMRRKTKVSEAPESVGARGLNQPTADDPDSDYMTCDEDHGSTGRTGPISQD